MTLTKTFIYEFRFTVTQSEVNVSLSGHSFFFYFTKIKDKFKLKNFKNNQFFKLENIWVADHEIALSFFILKTATFFGNLRDLL